MPSLQTELDEEGPFWVFSLGCRFNVFVTAKSQATQAETVTRYSFSLMQVVLFAIRSQFLRRRNSVLAAHLGAL